MKRMGRKHRSFFRICAVDSRNPRDGRVLEELGTYDPMVHETDARALLKAERIKYWLGVGAQPSDKVKVLIKKYGPTGRTSAQQATARERLSLPRAIPDPGEPAYIARRRRRRSAGRRSRRVAAGESESASSKPRRAAE